MQKTKTKRTPKKQPPGELIRDKIRASLLCDPASDDEVLTSENTRDVLREHYEEQAARWIPAHGITDKTERKRVLEAWQAANIAWDKAFAGWVNRGGPAPGRMLFEAILFIWKYPRTLAGLGLHWPRFRDLLTIRTALEYIEPLLRDAEAVLLNAARFSGMETTAIVNGAKALRNAYEPNPHGFGTATGVSFPDATSPLWPDCISAADWQKLHEPTKGDLIRLRDVLINLNHSTGKSTDKTQDIGNRLQSSDTAAGVRRENLLFSPGTMPAGPVGDALRDLQVNNPDALQILNLRKERTEKGRLLTFEKIADRFERTGKRGKKYTDERCRQIYNETIEKHPCLAEYVKKGLTRKAAIKNEAEETDRQTIKVMTSQSEFERPDLLKDKESGEKVINPGFRVDNSPRKFV